MNLNDQSELEAIDEILGGDDLTLLAEVHLGEDAAQFIKSDLGRYVIGRANQEIKIASEELKKVYWWRKNRIKYLQNKVARAENTKMWLVECLNAGQIALQTLESRQTEQ